MSSRKPSKKKLALLAKKAANRKANKVIFAKAPRPETEYLYWFNKGRLGINI